MLRVLNREKMNDCEKWLYSFLKGSEMVLVDLVRVNAKSKGFTRKQLKEARKNLGVKTFHRFEDGESTGDFYWYFE